MRACVVALFLFALPLAASEWESVWLLDFAENRLALDQQVDWETLEKSDVLLRALQNSPEKAYVRYLFLGQLQGLERQFAGEYANEALWYHVLHRMEEKREVEEELGEAPFSEEEWQNLDLPSLRELVLERSGVSSFHLRLAAIRLLRPLDLEGIECLMEGVNPPLRDRLQQAVEVGRKEDFAGRIFLDEALFLLAESEEYQAQALRLSYLVQRWTAMSGDREIAVALHRLLREAQRRVVEEATRFLRTEQNPVKIAHFLPGDEAARQALALLQRPTVEIALVIYWQKEALEKWEKSLEQMSTQEGEFPLAPEALWPQEAGEQTQGGEERVDW